MSDREIIELGRQARRLMDEPAFERAVSEVEQDIVAEWKSADMVGGREKAHAKMQVLFDLVEQLAAIYGAGLMEEEKEE